MIVTKRVHGYSSQRKYIQGKGFIDNLSSSLRGVGSYISQNRDLIAKPLLGAAGNLAAFGLQEGGKALLSHIMNRKTKKSQMDSSTQLNPKSKAILESIITGSSPVTNIIGSRIKRF